MATQESSGTAGGTRATLLEACGNLLAVTPGQSIGEALGRAHCMIDAVERGLIELACAADERGEMEGPGGTLWCLMYTLRTAKALVEAAMPTQEAGAGHG